jgi:hypothetical protein
MSVEKISLDVKHLATGSPSPIRGLNILEMDFGILGKIDNRSEALAVIKTCCHCTSVSRVQESNILRYLQSF